MSSTNNGEVLILLADRLQGLQQELRTIRSEGVKSNPATADPTALGLFGFALTTALLQGPFTTLTEPTSSQIAMGFGFFFGGLAQFCAGLLNYQRRNTFGCVAFCCFGAFWMSIAIYETLVFGKVYAPVPNEGKQLMLAMWGILTFLLWLCTFKLTIATSAVFLTLSLLFFFLAGGVGTSQSARNFTKFAGAWGFLVAAIAFYDGIAALLKDAYGRSILPVGPLSKPAPAPVQVGSLLPGSASPSPPGTGKFSDGKLSMSMVV
ncbi:hypothetical protein COHA_004189 [Chlorella ohadii]|uniref:GPR1/FUN34/yaaH family-domain-containing protein n=1 Tax=Chlorella ohadii TaxID=2649997 RepID=A0AAD5H343_9CHLO|nr:hypothetical protein COHA_004189 [Chlorella ohadii]